MNKFPSLFLFALLVFAAGVLATKPPNAEAPPTQVVQAQAPQTITILGQPPCHQLNMLVHALDRMLIELVCSEEGPRSRELKSRIRSGMQLMQELMEAQVDGVEPSYSILDPSVD